MKAWFVFLFFIAVLFTASTGFRVSGSEKPASTDTTKVSAKAPAADAKKADGLVTKLFKKIASLLEDDKKKREEKGVKSSADKSSYKHRFTHQVHGDMFKSGTPVGFRNLRDSKHLIDTVPFKPDGEVSLSAQVFGWHPYWSGDAYKAYNFKLLSTIAYFSYELDPETGGYTSIHDWETTPIVDLAHADGCKVLLTVTNFGASANSSFLGNYKAQQNLIDQLKQLLTARGADGVCIDFEGIAKSSKEDFGNFMTDLGVALHQANSDYILSMALYPIDYDDIYDFSVLNRNVDQFVMMGYEYYGDGSSDAGPVSPLQSGKIWWECNLETSIAAYLESGVTPEKFLVAFPYYGAMWETADLQVPSKAKEFIGHRSYQYIVDTFSFNSSLDSVSQSAYYAYVVDGGQDRQCWFEAVESLRAKYNYVKKMKLGGIGIWALGYDNGREELWQLLAEEFGSGKNAVAADSTSASASQGEGSQDGDGATGEDTSFADKVQSALKLLMQYDALVYLLIAFFIVLIIAAYVIALFNEGIRAYLLGSKMIKIYVIAFVFVILLIALRLFPVSEDGFLGSGSLLTSYSLIVLFGMIMGGIVTWLVSKIIIRRNTNIP